LTQPTLLSAAMLPRISRMLQCLLPVVWVAMLAAALTWPARADDARDCVQARDAATSIKACTELIRQQPANIVAYNHRGNGHRAAGNYDLAIADFAKALQIDSGFAPAYNGRCTALTMKGDYDGAIADCSKAIGMNPKYAKAYNGRAWAHLKGGNKVAALADVQKALELVA